MLKKNICVLFLIFAFGASAAFAQKIHTPAKNSPERAAILGALRVPVSKELKQNVSFLANDFKVQGNWAFTADRRETRKAASQTGKSPSIKSALKPILSRIICSRC